jgi:hypothetical protein
MTTRAIGSYNATFSVSASALPPDREVSNVNLAGGNHEQRQRDKGNRDDANTRKHGNNEIQHIPASTEGLPESMLVNIYRYRTFVDVPKYAAGRCES